mmetsp:Transcript_17912/g.32395  ORF Transcript_17912/g.32395 Transcript_17912/m.32395 type:complete len:110 (+) Transcript_17912:53-382(+)
MLRAAGARSYMLTMSRRCFATRAQQGSWSCLSHAEQSAWKALNYDQDSWEGHKPPPPWKEWSELTSTERSIAIHGLRYPTRNRGMRYHQKEILKQTVRLGTLTFHHLPA